MYSEANASSPRQSSVVNLEQVHKCEFVKHFQRSSSFTPGPLYVKQEPICVYLYVCIYPGVCAF